LESPLLRSLFDEQEPVPLTVSELNARVKLELERNFGSVWVEGEIVNFSTPRSGHWYFTLHDGGSQIRAACFKNSNYRIRFKPTDGLSVRIHGRLTVYEPRGEYQLMVESLEPVGKTQEIVIAGKKADENTDKMLAILHSAMTPFTLAIFKDIEDDTLESLLPHTAGMEMMDGKATAYICENYACQQPVNDLSKFQESLKGVGS
jgi:RecJ-like exonuclease